MKKNFKYAMMMATALVLGFSSCSSDNDLVDGGSIQEGVKTTAKIQLTQAVSPSTYAPTAGNDGEPTADEKKINNATLYIFNSTKVLEAVVKLEDDDNNVVTSKVFELTTGTKYFYAAVNIPGTEPTFSTGATMESVVKHILSLADVSEISDMTDAGFLMTNVKDADPQNIVQADASDVTSGAKNNITIQIGRAMIKASLKYEAATVNQPTTGKLDNVEFLLANNPKKMHLFPYFKSSGGQLQLETPLFNETTPDAAKYYPDLSATTSALTFISANGNAATYGTENSNATPKAGNSTFALIKGEFTPTAVVDKNGENPTNITPTAGSTYWRIKKADGSFTSNFYFEDPTGGTDITAAGPGAEALEYENGINYYAFYLADNRITDATKKYTLARNSYWKINITDVSGPGANTPGGDDGVVSDPDLPIEAKTNIKAEVEVLDWVVYEQNGGI